jgi:hypothetical protein
VRPGSTGGLGGSAEAGPFSGAERGRPRRGATPALIGALCGLAWAAGLRGLMATIAGTESTTTWLGTFAQLLLPGLVTGALLGWAARPWFVFAPFLFAVSVISPALFTTGIGGGAIAVPVFGIAGGYALAGRGPRWTRALAALVAVAPIPGWIWATTLFGPDFAVTTPRGAWIAVYFTAFVAVLAVGCANPLKESG